MSFIGALLTGGAALGAGILGSNAAQKAGTKGAKLAKKQQALGKGQVAEANKQYATDMPIQADVLAAQQAAANQGQAQQNRLLAQGLAREQGLLGGSNAQIESAFAPYQALGTQALSDFGGLYGDSPEAADAFVRRFESSPLYTENYRNMVDEANRSSTFAQAARGGLNSGATLRGLEENAAGATNRLLPQYVDYLKYGIGTGLQASQQATDAFGRNLGYGLQSSQFATAGGANAAQQRAQAIAQAQGAYGSNTATLGQNRLLNYATGVNTQAQGLTNQATALAGGAAGAAKAYQGAAQGVAQAVGQFVNPYGSSSGGGGGGGYMNPYGGSGQMGSYGMPLY